MRKNLVLAVALAVLIAPAFGAVTDQVAAAGAASPAVTSPGALAIAASPVTFRGEAVDVASPAGRDVSSVKRTSSVTDLSLLLGAGLLGVLKVKARKNADDGIEHWSGEVTPEQAAGVVNAVCDGKTWFLYKEGDELLPEHTPEHLHRNADKPGKPAPVNAKGKKTA